MPKIEAASGESPAPISKRKALGKVYDAILEVAQPGDVIFLTTVAEKDIPLSKRIYRSWQGIDMADMTRWHTAVFTEGRKERKGAQIRPYFVHSSKESGVSEVHVPPEFFTQTYDPNVGAIKTARLEIIHNPDLTIEQRDEVVRFTREQIGKKFDDPDWKRDLPTYAFGLPSKPLGPDRIACHGIAFKAYEQAGLTFPHGLDSAPFFNLARWTGAPMGHPRDRVDLDRLYLRDHHLYDDPRFTVTLAVYQDQSTGKLETARDPGKYSWDPRLHRVAR